MCYYNRKIKKKAERLVPQLRSIRDSYANKTGEKLLFIFWNYNNDKNERRKKENSYAREGTYNGIRVHENSKKKKNNETKYIFVCISKKATYFRFFLRRMKICEVVNNFF